MHVHVQTLACPFLVLTINISVRARLCAHAYVRPLAHPLYSCVGCTQHKKNTHYTTGSERDSSDAAAAAAHQIRRQHMDRGSAAPQHPPQGNTPWNLPYLGVYVGVSLCVRMRVCAFVRACVRACVLVFMYV